MKNPKNPSVVKKTSRNIVIILSAGEGSRLRPGPNKILLPIGGKPLIYFTLIAFQDHSEIDEIILVTSPEAKEQSIDIISLYGLRKVKTILNGSSSRQKSLQVALKNYDFENDDIILVHNGANPLVTYREISEVIEATKKYGAAIVARQLTSTVKLVTDKQQITKTLDRNKVFAAETPQAAKANLLLKASSQASEDCTDEAMMLEKIGVNPQVVKASEQNFKVTVKEDYQRVRHILGDRSEKFLVGIGQDSHRFDRSGKLGLILGGVTFKDHFAFEANSDGDVILHAIFNAISQCLSEKSLGFYADPLCAEGIKDSKKYLKIMLDKLAEKSLKIHHLGLMLEGVNPKIDPISGQIKLSLAKLLDLEPASIGITATTGESLTAFGRGDGLQCFAIISVEKI